MESPVVDGDTLDVNDGEAEAVGLIVVVNDIDSLLDYSVSERKTDFIERIS